MLASLLMGLVGGQRALVPLAAVSVAAAGGGFAVGPGPLRILAHPLVAAGTVVLAAGEMAGDKKKTAPDRIVPIGLAARFTTAAIAGAVLAPRRRLAGAAVGGVAAVAASYPGWRARMASMGRYGQTGTGLVEDALVVLGAIAVLRGAGGRVS